MADFLNDKAIISPLTGASSPESLMRGVKQIQDQLSVIEEILLERGLPSNQIRGKNRHQHSGKNNGALSSAEVNKIVVNRL